MIICVQVETAFGEQGKLGRIRYTVLDVKFDFAFNMSRMKFGEDAKHQNGGVCLVREVFELRNCTWNYMKLILFCK